MIEFLKNLFKANLFRNIVSVLIIITLGISISELWLFKVSPPNYYQRINTYFYIILPLLSVFLVLYFFSAKLKNIIISPNRGIRYRLVLWFSIVAILPSTPVFLLSSDMIRRSFSTYLNIDISLIKNTHYDLLKIKYEDLKKSLVNETQRSQCTTLTAKKVPCFGQFGQYYLNNTSKKIVESYNKFYHNKSKKNLHVHFFIYEELDKVAFKDKGNFNKEQFKKIIAVFTIGERKYFIPLTDKETQVFFRAEKFKSNFSKAMTYLQPLELALDIFFGILFFIVLLVTVLLAIFVSRELSSPIISIAKSAQLIAKGDFTFSKEKLDAIIHAKAPGEIQVLATSISQMLDDLERYKEEQYQIQKSEAWQEVAQSIAHEIKNPLTPMQLSIQRITRQMSRYADVIPEEFQLVVKQGSASFLDQIETIRVLLNSFSELARLPVPVKIEMNLTSCINIFIQDYCLSDLVVRFDNRVVYTIVADESQFKQVLLNLYTNSVGAIQEKGNDGFKGEIDISISKSDTGTIVKVWDNGIGIENPDKAIKANYTTKENGKGLGLAIVNKILSDHNAELKISSETGEKSFTEVMIFFPN